MNRLYEQLGTVRPQGLKMLYALERVGFENKIPLGVFGVLY